MHFSLRVARTKVRKPPRFVAGPPIRVLFVNDHLGYEGGCIHGATTYFLTTLTSFDRRTVEPRLCILRAWHPAAEQFEAKGVSPIFLNRAKWDPRALFDLIRVIRDHGVDVLHLSGMKGALLGAAAARLTARPALVHLHDMHPLKPGLRVLQRRASRRMARTIVVSEPVREFAVKEYGVAHDRIEVLPNGIRLDSIGKASGAARRRVRTELGLNDATPVVGLTARLCPEKGHDYIIRALPALRARCPDAVLLIAGDGPARADCESLVRNLGLGDAVRFLGHRRDVPDLLAAMDAVVVPSVCEEGFGYSALEGIAAGRPVVAFVSEGLRQIVLDGITGFLVPKGDIGRLAASLADVLTNDDLARRLGEGGRRHTQAFSIERHVRRLERLYAQAMAGSERAYRLEAVVARR